MVLARWGGLGTHRYQVGFSGDVHPLSWDTLAYQPYYSFTAMNVGYGMWSHDIEGPAGDLEMYTRWVQWAAYSPIFRSHERGMSGGGCADALTTAGRCSVVEPWNVPGEFFEANRAAMQVEREPLERCTAPPCVFCCCSCSHPARMMRAAKPAPSSGALLLSR
jgi:alpha-glucosidase (family GH31 glycosyl hydrolase)